MSNSSDSPAVAPRRSSRRSLAGAAASSTSLNRQSQSGDSGLSRTPNTSSSRKRPRAVEPDEDELEDSITVVDSDAEPEVPQRAIPKAKRRSPVSTAGVQGPAPNEIHIVPFRAILDSRTKRRIRRHGLSEVMHTVQDERRSRAKKNVEEMARLREELASAEAANEQLREQSSLLSDPSRLEELERELAELRRRGQVDVSRASQVQEGSSPPSIDDGGWDMAAGDGFTDNESFMSADDQFADDTTVGPPSSSPAPLPQKDDTMLTIPSPTKLATPELPQRKVLSLASGCNAGTQAELEDPEKELEVADLRRELVGVKTTLETQERLEAQLKTKLATALGNDAEDPDIHLQVDIMIQSLADKTTSLAELEDSLSPLGTPGLQPQQIVTALSDSVSSARQQLEKLFPKEASLITSRPAAQVIQILSHLLPVSLAKLKQRNAALDKYQLLDASLRKLLHDRATTISQMTVHLKTKNARIVDLEANTARLQTAIESYQASIASLETRIQEAEEAATKTAEETQEYRQLIAHRDEQIDEMSAQQRAMVTDMADLRTQLAQSQVDNDVQAEAIQMRHAEQLAVREGTLHKLRWDVASVRGALATAQEELAKSREEAVGLQEQNERLKDEHSRLKGEATTEKKAARERAAAMQQQLLGLMQMNAAALQ